MPTYYISRSCGCPHIVYNCIYDEELACISNPKGTPVNVLESFKDIMMEVGVDRM